MLDPKATFFVLTLPLRVKGLQLRKVKGRISILQTITLRAGNLGIWIGLS